MNYMQSAKTLALGIVSFSLVNAPALWAADAGREDNSYIFVWIFLAFCALIIVAQLIPAVLMLFGFARGLKKKPESSTSEAVDNLASPKS